MMTVDPSASPAAGQVWSAEAYSRNAGFVPALGKEVLDLLDPKPGETILDIGCGDGVLTRALAERGAKVTGLEPDPELAADAKARGLKVMEQDAHAPFGSGCFDAIFSNAALHWMRDPSHVLSNTHEALRTGGRFVAEQGGFGNVAAVVTAMTSSLEAAGLPHRSVSPWDFPSVTLQRSRLEQAGFEVNYIALIPRPTPLPTGMAGWLETFAGPFTRGLTQGEATALLRDAERRLSALYDPAEGWIADYVRLRFKATKQSSGRENVTLVSRYERP